ncbi:MAG: o-succinylbenzoate--CoA ligase [Bacteroidetes bacterium]|nr:o-succinylbenzoate--CoA ligase [Bacteroidota bacterium]
MKPLAMHASDIPDRTALIQGDRRWSWGELYTEAGAIATVLQTDYGIKAGAIVATIAENDASHVFLLHALFLLGAIAAPLNIRLTAVEREHQLALLGPDLLVHSEAAATAAAQSSRQSGSVDPAVPVRGEYAVSCRVADLLSAAAQCRGKHVLPETAFDASAPCSILFTSGTTTCIKAVMHTWRNHHASAYGSAGNLGVYPDDNWLCIIPLYHIGGLAIVTRSLFYGTAMTIRQGFDAREICADLQRAHVTLLSIVPTMLRRLLDCADDFSRQRLPALRAVLLGGASATEDLWKNAHSQGLPVLGTYGLTESCSQVVTASPDDVALMAGTAGRPIRGAVVRITDDAGQGLAAGNSGEIWVRGPMVANGYFRNRELSERQFTGGWLRTGDIGMFDHDGLLHVSGRADEVIITGGENVHPYEIEQVLLGIEGLRDAAVTGLEDEEWGMKIAAAIVVSDGTDIGRVETRCREKLAGYKIPRFWKIVNVIPRTASGKIIREQIRKFFRP